MWATHGPTGHELALTWVMECAVRVAGYGECCEGQHRRKRTLGP